MTRRAMAACRRDNGPPVSGEQRIHTGTEEASTSAADPLINSRRVSGIAHIFIRRESIAPMLVLRGSPSRYGTLIITSHAGFR